MHLLMPRRYAGLSANTTFVAPRPLVPHALGVRLALLLVASTASAGVDPPCAGCLLDVPKADGPRPMLVVMHGDREGAQAAHARWRAAAKRRGWVLLSLDCPITDGCTKAKQHSWWQWGGEPQWVLDRVAEVRESVAIAARAVTSAARGDERALTIDPARIYLAGWSGGATYLGMRAIAWPDTFAAIVIHGGGQPPWDEAACPTKPLPAYFLVGTKNPLHHLAKGLRAYLEGCTQPVTWDVVQGADHAGEHRALTTRKALAILDWLAARPRK